MNCRLAPLLWALFLLFSLAVTAVGAEEKGAVAPSPFGSVLELLRSKKIITDQEAKTLARSGGSASEARSLVELLKDKGVISAEEAATIVPRETPPAPEPGMLPASQDAKFIAQLRARWVKNKNRGKDFDEWFAGVSDPEEIIGRMRVMGALSATESDELETLYRDHYVTGAIAAALQTKEQEYLERVRKGVAWELDEKIREKTKGDWSQRIKLSGDLRLRYEGDFFAQDNALIQNIGLSQDVNTQTDRQQMRLRARLGVNVKVADDVEAGFSLATGSASNPVSTNVTLGDSFLRKPIQLDLAYLKWTPSPSFTLLGGRFANPWLYTDLVWDPDLNFDGVAFQYTPVLNDAWSLFFNGGVFALQEIELSQHDKWLLGGQAGFQYKRRDDLCAKLGVGLYDFRNTVGVVNDPSHPGLTDYSAPTFQQKGNTPMDINPDPNAIKVAYAAAYRELNLTGQLDLGYWHPVHVILDADYVNNIGFNSALVAERSGNTLKETEGFQLGLSVGYPSVRDLWEWKGMFAYKYLEADAVMDAFTDSDFHLGGTNAKGWIAGAQLGLAKNVWLSARWLSANEISGPPLSIDVFQFDVNAKF
jgi:hypothetical protein